MQELTWVVAAALSPLLVIGCADDDPCGGEGEAVTVHVRWSSQYPGQIDPGNAAWVGLKDGTCAWTELEGEAGSYVASVTQETYALAVHCDGGEDAPSATFLHYRAATDPRAIDVTCAQRVEDDPGAARLGVHWADGTGPYAYTMCMEDTCAQRTVTGPGIEERFWFPVASGVYDIAVLLYRMTADDDVLEALAIFHDLDASESTLNDIDPEAVPAEWLLADRWELAPPRGDQATTRVNLRSDLVTRNGTVVPLVDYLGNLSGQPRPEVFELPVLAALAEGDAYRLSTTSGESADSVTMTFFAGDDAPAWPEVHAGLEPPTRGSSGRVVEIAVTPLADAAGYRLAPDLGGDASVSISPGFLAASGNMIRLVLPADGRGLDESGLDPLGPERFDDDFWSLTAFGGAAETRALYDAIGDRPGVPAELVGKSLWSAKIRVPARR